MNESQPNSRHEHISKSAMPPRFLFMTQVWGRAFTEAFATAALPSFVSSGNLGAFDKNSEFLIFTTEADAKFLQESKSYQVLKRLVTVREKFIHDARKRDPYVLMNECQSEGAREAEERDLPAVFLQPDGVLSEGCLSRIGELWREGKRCVLVPSARSVRETFVPEVVAKYGRDDGTLSVPPQALIGLLLRHLHEIEESCFWDSPNFTTHPSHIFWPVGDHGVVAKCAHIHPLMVHAVVKNTGFDGRTLDDDYFFSTCPDIRQVHFVTDSDEMFYIEFSARTKSIGPIFPNRPDMDEISAWVARSTNAHQLKLLDNNVLLHSKPLDSSWTSVEREVNAFTAELRRKSKHVPLSLYFHDRELFVAKVRDLLRSENAERLGPVTRIFYRGVLASTGVADKILDPLERFYRAAAHVWRMVSFNSVGPNILNPNWLAYAAFRPKLAAMLKDLDGDVLLVGGQDCRVETLVAPGVAAKCRFYRVDRAIGPCVDMVVDGSENWGLAAESFDTVVCVDFLEAQPSAQKAIERMTTLLRPGGRLVLCAGALRPSARRETDRHRFTLQSLMALAQPAVKVEETAQCGGLGALLGLSLMVWAHHVTQRPLVLRLFRLVLAPVSVPLMFVGNLVFRSLDMLDRTGLFYLQAVVSGTKQKKKSEP